MRMKGAGEIAPEFYLWKNVAQRSNTFTRYQGIIIPMIEIREPPYGKQKQREKENKNRKLLL